MDKQIDTDGTETSIYATAQRYTTTNVHTQSLTANAPTFLKDHLVRTACSSHTQTCAYNGKLHTNHTGTQSKKRSRDTGHLRVSSQAAPGMTVAPRLGSGKAPLPGEGGGEAEGGGGGGGG